MSLLIQFLRIGGLPKNKVFSHGQFNSRRVILLKCLFMALHCILSITSSSKGRLRFNFSLMVSLKYFSWFFSTSNYWVIFHLTNSFYYSNVYQSSSHMAKPSFFLNRCYYYFPHPSFSCMQDPVYALVGKGTVQPNMSCCIDVAYIQSYKRTY